MPIIISKNGKDAERVERADFAEEGELQEYIRNNPDSIPIYELDEDKRLFVVKREFPTNAGPIDALAVDQGGEIYIVETKLYKNPDKRYVIAQVLDYGAALWKHLNDFSEFLSILDTECQDRFDLTFREQFADFFALDEDGVGVAFHALEDNLDKGKIKFVILMDSIEERLKDLILYVNQNSQFDVYAAQLEYYRFEEYEIMIPKLFGVEVKKNIGVSASAGRRAWDEESFIAQSKEQLGKDAEKVIQLYNYFKEKDGKINWGTGKVNASFSPVFKQFSETISPFTIYSDGKIWVKFRWLLDHSSKDVVKPPTDKFMDIIRSETDIKLPDDQFSGDFTIESKEFIKNSDTVVKAVTNIFGS